MPKLIYVADDEKNICFLIENFLEKEGYEVECFGDGESLLDAFQKKAPDLCILDIMMPGMDGLTVCTQIRKTSHVPIIIVSAKDSPLDRITGITLGSDDYMVKPFLPLELVTRVKALFRRVDTFSGQEEEAQRPNILILLADDAGYADFGFMGATDIQTPNIDRLAAEGCIFTDAHVAAPVSSPSRSMMLTGRYGQRYGYECNLDKPGDGLPDDEELLPALLKRYDYRTGCIGKWHLGSEPSQRPNAKGFDTFYGLLAGHRSYFYNPETSDKDGSLQQYQHNGRKLSFDGYFTDELASKAQQFVTESEQPFMLYMSFTAPHSPNEATEEDLARFEGQPRQKYAAMMYALDRGVGKIVDELKAAGKFDNTIIFFLSDNGGSTTNQSSNLPLKGFKGNKFEGGQRVPFFVVWGDRFKRDQRFTGLTSSLDIFATVVDALDIPEEGLHKPIDGVSLLPYLSGEKSGNPHEALFWRKMDTRAIRSGSYKLIITRGVDSVLYNMDQDVEEMHDLLSSEPEKARELMEQLSEWEQACCKDPLWIEEGWAEITNGLHERLMKNEIRTAQDL